MGRWEHDDAKGDDDRGGSYMDSGIQDLLDEGDMQGALGAANENVLRNPGLASAWIDKGDVLYEMARYYEASSAYGRALDIDAEQPELLTKKGLAHELIGDYGSAMLCYSRALRLEPEDTVAATKKAHCLLHISGGGDGPANPIAESISLIEGVLKGEERDVDALRVYYEALDLIARHGDALEVTTRLLEVDPDDTDNWACRSDQLARLGKNDAALSAADRAIRSDPSSAQARTARGVALAGLARYAEALESYDDAISLDPGRGSAWAGRAESLAAAGRHAEASDAMFVAISVDPGNASALDDPLWKGMREGIVKRLGGRVALRRRMAGGRASALLRCGSASAGAST